MQTALVTGASRGVGRGVAIALADAGYRVFATGRTIGTAVLPDAVIRLHCDHANDDETAAAFERVGDVDILVNSAWGGYERMIENGQFTWTRPFWEQPMHRWTSMIDAGVRAAFVASAHAARKMIPQRRGLIVNISFWPAQKYVGNAIYGIAKAATDKLTFDTAHELRPHGIAVISLYPGLVRTESVMQAAEAGWLDISNSESPEFLGRVVAGLARDPKLIERSGSVCVAAQAAVEMGIADIDGRQPRALTIEMI
jgi:NAD(P)-dependent dehydrogenase (short-subunit alcohol dehydrogenase family)